MSHFSFIFYQEKSKKNLNTIASLEARKALPFSAKKKEGLEALVVFLFTVHSTWLVILETELLAWVLQIK